MTRSACRSIVGVLVVLGHLGGGCDRDGPAEQDGKGDEAVWFTDVTRAVGLDFAHEAGRTGDYFLPQIMGSGAALFDFDGDGRLDIYLIHNGDPEDGARNALFRQGDDGRFVDVSAGSGVDVSGRGMGAAAGDVDNDGRVDLLLTEYSDARLFLNRGDGSFADITRESGIDNPFWGTSASFFDHDRDGWLDLVIVNYVVYSPTRVCGNQGGKRDYCGPSPFPGTMTRLFRNLGSPGPGGAGVHFEDVTVPAGLAERPGPGLGVLCADLTGDRWPDILVANDARANHLWVNRGDGTFAEEAVLRGLAYSGMGKALADMGIACGDGDGDGLLDLYVTHLTDEYHTYWRQGPPGQFLDRTGAVGLTATRWRGTGFGTVLGDFDHDGAPDLAQVNGRVKFATAPSPPGESFWMVYEQRNQLFANDGAGAFRDISDSNDPFCGSPGIGRALALGDVDNDGALDMLVSFVAAPARLYRNVAPKRGHWLMVRAIDPALGGRDAHGAQVTVVTASGPRVGLVNPGSSYLSSNDPRVHFGLGAADRVDRISVIWPDGREETFDGTTADRLIVLRRGTGTPPGPAASD